MRWKAASAPKQSLDDEAAPTRHDIPLIDKIVGYLLTILLFGWIGVAYLRSLF